MWLEAILTRTDLERVVQQFIPIELRLGDDGHLTLDLPTDVTLVPDDCVRFVCRAQLHWPVLGMSVPVTIDSVIVRLRPEIGGVEKDSLTFKVSIEHLDVSVLPRMIDNAITAKINEELVAKHVELAWNFRETISHAFDLPDTIESSSVFAIEVKTGVVKVTADALGFAVQLLTAVRRRGEPPLVQRAPSRVHETDVLPSSAANAIARRPMVHSATPGAALAAGGAFVGFILAATFGLGRLSRRRLARR